MRRISFTSGAATLGVRTCARACWYISIYLHIQRMIYAHFPRENTFYENLRDVRTHAVKDSGLKDHYLSRGCIHALRLLLLTWFALSRSLSRALS